MTRHVGLLIWKLAELVLVHVSQHVKVQEQSEIVYVEPSVAKYLEMDHQIIIHAQLLAMVRLKSVSWESSCH